MLMRLIKKSVDFAAGVAIGSVAGAAVGYLVAPTSGDDLRKGGHDLVDSAREAGERARLDREAELRDMYRMRVGNQQALTSQPDNVGLGDEQTASSLPVPS